MLCGVVLSMHIARSQINTTGPNKREPALHLRGSICADQPE